jgi:ribose transport system ATP-binding protein
MNATQDAPVILQASRLTHRYGPVEVLSGIDLDVRAGEVHAIIGENGAGKSTLMKILSGYLKPSEGQVALRGVPVAFAGPQRAEAAGIVLVHQEILLAPHLTVAQNLFLGREINGRFGVDDGTMNTRADEVLASLKAHFPASAVVEGLSIAQRQLVQIARALMTPKALVIFDEPTASLTPSETQALLGVIADIRAQGVAVLFISHRLHEVKSIADRVSVLRDGRLVGTRDASELQPEDMALMMVGRDLGSLFPAKSEPRQDVALAVRDLSVEGGPPVSFHVRRGEVVGFAGLIGAGRTELFEAIAGLRAASGTIVIGGRERPAARRPREWMKAGLAYVTEDRKGRGLLLGQSLGFNVTLPSLERFSRAGVLDGRREAEALAEVVRRFDIRARSTAVTAGQLSGGNQQKLLLAKMLQLAPDIVVVDEPTRGVDIGAKSQIYAIIAALAAEGKAVVVISSEMPEVIGLSHRVYVMRNGRIAAELAGDAVNERDIVFNATGVRDVAAEV